ncbi:hypothetical protein F5Y16DRAFT_16385 [Xylariaceae sp. FL0255]|nr:hypothetical protein F5Y16DRAFT_16385 [Xylariaceae sp. FL0255]
MESNGYSADSLLEPLTHIPHINREHLAAMADAAVADHDFGSTSPSSPNQKRKRGVDSSPDSRRSKRSIPTTGMSGTPNPPSAAYVEGAVEAARQAAQAAEAANANHELSALQQATIDRHESSDPANASSTAAAALNSIYPHIHIPQTTEAQFAAQANVEAANHHDTSFSHSDILQNHGLPEAVSSDISPRMSNGVRPARPHYTPSGANVSKPAVGTEEWHKLRKDNHKNVERRRRETINEGINELAKIVPNCEKNKGSILAKAVTFIQQLKENEAQNIEKWTLEKLLTEQALNELSVANEKMKKECERSYQELAAWKNLAQSNGLDLPQPKDES